MDDIVEMLVEALENDDDIVQSDKTLHATPFGQSKVFNHWPMNTNYIQPNLILAKLLSPFGLQGYGPYGQNYGYNQGYGYNTGEINLDIFKARCRFSKTESRDVA